MNSNFKNPNHLPIDQVILEADDGEKIPALSERWVEKRCYAKYVPLKLKNGKIDDSFDLDDEWLIETEFFNKDLEWILGLNFHRFWSHALYDKDFLNPLLFFLQESVPFYIPIRRIVEDNEIVVQLYDRVCRNVLVIVCRLITNRESDKEFMSKDKQAEILYKNFIISIPMLMDMLALYGYNNKNVMQRIIDTLLKIESKYTNDLKMGIKFIQSTFTTMKKQLETIDSDNRDLFENYEDLSLYLMNIATTLNLIIELVPNDIKAYCTRELRLEQSIAFLYDHFIPTLYQNAYNVDSDAWYLTYINYARVELINCFRNLVNRTISNIFNAGEKNRQKLSDEILSTFTESAGFRMFIVDYVQLYPIEMDLDVIMQCGKKIDSIKLKFVQDAYKAEPNVPSNASNGYHIEPEIQPDYDEFEGACSLPLNPPEPKESSSINIEDVMQLETSKILDVFPNYGVGYIRRLLNHYDNKSEMVITKILEGALDERFQGCDEQEQFIPAEVPDKVFAATGVERSNIYDGDKFDVMRNDEFGGLVMKNGRYINKKEPKTYHDLLNDKSHIENIRERYNDWGLVADGGNDDAEYDDEYDDSYEVYADTEAKIHLPRKMRDMLPADIDSGESEEEPEPEQKAPINTDRQRKNPMDFCENPEIIRARREQHYQHKMAKKFPNRQQPATEQKPRDVVGAQKGTGQSNDVLRNRQLKNTNKSSRANHSRKAGSTFKQSRGMF